MKQTLYYLIVSIALISCGKSSENSASYDEGEAMEAAEGSANDFAFAGMEEEKSSVRNVSQQVEVEKKIIKNAFLREQVKNVDASTEKIKAGLSQYAAYISTENRISNNYELKNTIEIRVPAKHFEGLIGMICAEGVFLNEKRITSKDVTEEFIDIELRLKTKKTVLKRYQELLRDKASTVEEVLMAEDKILVLQEEIEAKEGRLKYLQSQVSMSTVELEIYEVVEYSNTPIFEDTFGKKAADGIANGWSFLVGFVLVLINVWPLLLVIALIVWKGGWLWRKIRRK